MKALQSKQVSCLRYCKSTSFQANHNTTPPITIRQAVVCDTAKVRVFKQITTLALFHCQFNCCLRYCKSTSFQANHNQYNSNEELVEVVCDTAKVRVFKQITTEYVSGNLDLPLFAILQKYEFSSKSQLALQIIGRIGVCLRYCKSTSFQANHNI